MSGDEFDLQFKIMMIGESGVGKSCIVQRFVNDTYDEDSVPTVGADFSRKIVKTSDGHRVNMMVWDTAGQERFRALTTSYYRGIHAFFVVYDVSDMESFKRVSYWLDEIKNNATLPDALRVLVANKIDLRNSAESDSGHVYVTRKEGADFARENSMLFFECSALTREGVFQAFEEVAYKIIEEPSLCDTGAVAPKEDTVKVEEKPAETDAAAGGCWC